MTITVKTISVNTSLCDGNGLCADAAPEVFRLNDDDDELELLQSTVEGELIKKVETAINSCPKAALRLTNE